jgi:RNA polymerase sigma factor (sigma-70 family)
MNATLDDYKVKLAKLMESPFRVIECNEFLDSSKESEIIGPMPGEEDFASERQALQKKLHKLQPEMYSFYMEPLLSREQERHLFRKYNYFKFKALKLLQKCNPTSPVPVVVDQIEEYLQKAKEVKSQIATSNARLVMSVAKKQPDYKSSNGGAGFLMEIVSDGNMGMIRAIDYFDWQLGNKFSTYATWAIIDTCRRNRLQRQKHSVCFNSDEDVLFDVPAPEIPEPELDFNTLMETLNERQKEVLVKCFGLDGQGTRRLEEIGRSIGVSKERVRQIRESALCELRIKMGVDDTHTRLAKGA